MLSLAIVDAGPLYAWADRDDRHHLSTLQTLRRTDLRLVLAPLAIAEAAYLVGTRWGSAAEHRFWLGVGQLDVDHLEPEDFPRIAHLVRQYGSFPLRWDGRIDCRAR